MGFVEIDPHRGWEFDVTKGHVLEEITHYRHTAVMAAVAVSSGRIARTSGTCGPKPTTRVVFGHGNVGGSLAGEFVFSETHEFKERGRKVGFAVVV